MSDFEQLLSPKGKITRGKFAFWGFVLFAFKYNVDRLVAVKFGHYWLFYNYLFSSKGNSLSELSLGEKRFYIYLVATSIPFIICGIFLCIRRLRDSGLPLYLVFLFFVPALNILFFGMLCVLPSKLTEELSQPKPLFLDRLIPKSKTGSALFACGVSVLFALLLTLLSVNYLGEYGWGIFIAIPFFIGFSSVLLYAYHHHPVNFKEATFIGFSGLFFFGLFLFILAMEGVICLAMALPLGIIISYIGSMVAYTIQSFPKKVSAKLFSLNILLIPVIMIAENNSGRKPEVIELRTSVVINATPEKVWKQLVTFNEIAPPHELIFKTGIAYPIDAKISGTGVGATRKCNFTTGSFIEPITVWDEPRLLRFDVFRQPVPMSEISFYKDVHAPHLEGYFASLRGQFHLTETADHKTILEGTTWYQNKMWPANYWKIWSDYILHKIHLRVLNHIKKESELGNCKPISGPSSPTLLPI